MPQQPYHDIVTVDRGFYSVGVMAAIREAGHKMVMPAVKYKKDDIRKYHTGEIGAITERTMTSGGITESFKLVILKRQEVEHKMSDEFRALAKLHRKKVCRVLCDHHV